MLSALLVAGTSFRRVATLRALLLVVAGGALAGLLTLALPSPALVREVFLVLVSLFAALLVLPQAAAFCTGDRRGGYEALQGARPVTSVAWALGRLVGGFVAGLLLVLVLATVAQFVGGHKQVPHALEGRVAAGSGATWRFALPAESAGPFDLDVEAYVPFAGSGELAVTTRRAGGVHEQTVDILPVRRHTVVVPDLAPERGDLYLSLEPRGGVVLGVGSPRLVVGSRPLAEDALALPRDFLGRLAFALLVVLAASQAFRFETVCLAGLLALAVRPPTDPETWAAAALSAVVFSSLGATLVRRQALP